MINLNSFTVDHTRMTAPSVRISKIIQLNNIKITVFDLRFIIPNKDAMPIYGLHTVEHFFADFMHNYFNTKKTKTIDISPMGCRTGFYMSIIGKINEKKIIYAWKLSMKKILSIKDKNKIPGKNIYQCGNYKMHSLKEAKQIAYKIITSKIKINKNNELKISTNKLNYQNN